MKKIKKLTLRKEAIVNLENKEMNGLKGGVNPDSGSLWCPSQWFNGCNESHGQGCYVPSIASYINCGATGNGC